MAGMSGTFRVVDPTAPRRVIDGSIRGVAEELMSAALSRTPRKTGRLAAGWSVSKARVASYRVANFVRYAPYVEYGTRNTPAHPMLGPALATMRARYGR